MGRTVSYFFVGTLRRRLVTSVVVVNAMLMMAFMAGRQTWVNGALCAGMAVLMGSAMAFVIGTHFVRRLKAIKSVMVAVKAGNQNARVVLPGADEAADLASCLNAMLEAVQQRAQEIISLKTALEKQVTERNHQLQCTNKELAAFSYSVSHDLRAPLRAIDGFSGILEEGYGEKLDDEGRRLLSIIRSNASKMNRLISDLRALSGATQSEFNCTRLDMRSLVEATYNEVAPEEIRRQFKFTLGAMPDAWGDAVLLQQVWVNLISNALKFTAKSPVKEIEIGGFIKGGDVVYYIKDSGVGFNPHYADKLFGAFQRLHKAAEFEGSGIGLAIVQRIIRRHEGQVWAEGQENAGATFSFSMPNKPCQGHSLRV